ncbi:hypothetical protein M0812_21319 [Anaeramoeba flamelloides]|uniref:Uncharacterized protein n=1 Tax=Anaeramoeba flamelloides TaxID=1746091 RepID=A0AAV7YYD7_9EUKA|nr:hypothetical protein M0812_21319 [Anaeramoeba flamelloides]
MTYNRRYNNYSRENERNKRYENYPNRNYRDNRDNHDNRDRQYSGNQPNYRQFERKSYSRNRPSFQSQRENEIPNSSTPSHRGTYHQSRHHHYHHNSPYYSQETDGVSQQQPRRQQRKPYYQNSSPQIHNEQQQQTQLQSQTMKPKIQTHERNEYNQMYSETKSHKVKREIQEFNEKIKQQTSTHPLNPKFENTLRPNTNFYDPINNSNNLGISDNNMNESTYSSSMNTNSRKLRNLFDLSDLTVSMSTKQKIEQQQENIKNLFRNSGMVERDKSLENTQKEIRLLQNQLFDVSHQVEIRRIEKEEIERRVLLREKELERLNKIKKQIENEDPLRIIHF